MHDAPASPPAEESPSYPLEATPSPPAPVDVPASPMEDVVPGASPIESGEDSSAPVSPEEVPADEQSAEVSGEGEDGQENDEKEIADINEGDEKATQDNASSQKEIESPEAEPEEEEGEELEESSLAAGGPSDDIASPAPEESKEADDGGVLLGNLLDTEDISPSSEEGLLEDTSNGMEDISEPGSTDGLVDNLEAVVREQDEAWRQESKDSECPVHKERKTKHKKETCQYRKHRRHRRTNSNNEDREEGEIVDEKSPSSSSRQRKEVETTADDLAELAPRINISELPRIPKLKRSEKVASHIADSESSIGGDSTSATAASHVEVKRTSVLGRVDSGSDISWKKLSKHSQEHSFELKYRKGRDNGNADGLSRGFS
nr:fibrous sheath CABYR-binding protein-like [Rhipicephalus microplus]